MEERTGWIVRLRPRMDEIVDGGENWLDSETESEDVQALDLYVHFISWT